MANELTRLREIWVDVESSFGADPSTDGSGYTRIPAGAIEWTPTQETIERELQRDGLGKSIPSAIGGQGGTLSFQTPLVGAATAGASGVAAAAPVWLSALFGGCGFTEANGTGTVTTGTGSNTTVLDVTSAAGVEVGAPVMVAGEVRQVTARDTVATPNTLTVAPALSAAPGNGVVVYASSSYFLDDVGTATTLAFVAKLHGSEDTILGGKGTFSIGSTDARGRPMIAWVFEVDSWSATSNKSALPTALNLKSNGLLLGAPFHLGSTQTAVANFALNPGIEVTAKAGTSGAQGRVGWVVTGEAQTMDVSVYLNEAALRTAFSTPTMQRAIMQIGSTHTNVFAVVGSDAQVSFPGNDDVGGLRGHNLSLRFRESAISLACLIGVL